MSLATLHRIPRSPKILRRYLKKIGAFHATGLHWEDRHFGRKGVIQPNLEWANRWHYDGRWTIMVLENGEVWLRRGEMKGEEAEKVLKRACPRGKRMIVLYNGIWEPDPGEMGYRLIDPYSSCNGSADPEPQWY